MFKEGAYLLRPDDRQGGSQALDLQPAQGGFVEFTFDEAGLYPIVTHKFANVGKGALGLFQAGEVEAAGQAVTDLIGRCQPRNITPSTTAASAATSPTAPPMASPALVVARECKAAAIPDTATTDSFTRTVTWYSVVASDSCTS